MSAEGGDTVARWSVPLQDKVHKIEFEHGTTTGKRVVRVDGREILRRDWMFKLVGKEHFSIGNMKCTVNVEALGTFAYEYSLEVNGKAFEKFREEQKKKLLSWEICLAGEDTRICLDKDSMEVWVNGRKIDTAEEGYFDFMVFPDNWMIAHLNFDTAGSAHNNRKDGEFVDDGTETHFEVGRHVCKIKAISSGKKKTGVIHELYVDRNHVPHQT